VERYKAKTVTLDTLAYLVTDSDCKTYIIEDSNVPGRNVEWYTRKGYAQFRVSRKLAVKQRVLTDKPNRPLYPLPTPDDPNRKLMAVFMVKTADAILAEPLFDA